MEERTWVGNRKRIYQRLEWNWSQQIYDDRVCCNFFDDKFDEVPQ